jgi:hypothetical protein
MLARVPVFRDNELPSLRLFDDTDAGWVVIQLHLQAGSGNEDEIPDGVVTRIWIAHFEKVFEEPEESFVFQYATVITRYSNPQLRIQAVCLVTSKS